MNPEQAKQLLESVRSVTRALDNTWRLLEYTNTRSDVYVALTSKLVDMVAKEERCKALLRSLLSSSGGDRGPASPGDLDSGLSNITQVRSPQ